MAGVLKQSHMQSREELNHLFQSCYGQVLGAAYRYAPSEDLIDDIVQQTYLEFLTKSLEGTLKIEKDAGSLLYQISKRRACDLWRKRSKETPTPVDILALRLIHPEDENEADMLETESQLKKLALCIEKLPPKSKAMLEQHYFDGVAMKEIAQEQQKSENAIYRTFYRIRINLKTCIEKIVIR